MTWSKEDWGAFLMGVGVLLIILSVPLSLETLSSVGINVGNVVSIDAGELPPVSVSALIVGIVLLLIGAYLNGFLKR